MNATTRLTHCLLALLFLATTLDPAFGASRNERLTIVPKWGRFERAFQSSVVYTNPVQQTELAVAFTSPSGDSQIVPGFWDGGQTWRVRFSPNEVGTWLYSSAASDRMNLGLDDQSGSFLVTAHQGRQRFDFHGAIRVSRDGRFLQHEDGTPFFWLADTAWSGPLLAKPDEWEHYLRQRARQKFTAVQWVATQYRAAPNGDRDGDLPYAGHDRVSINLKFFQKMDQKVDAINRAGLASVPVLLWAFGGGANPVVNPGFSLPEDQAILLARYMVARWGASHGAWILAGDGDYRGEKSEKWKRIGRAVFGSISHAPVSMHPGGMQWVLPEFYAEKWMSIQGYQSGHGDGDKTFQWLFAGPPATDWKKPPFRPFINLEPPYENHVAYDSKTPISPLAVRRAVYWSLLNAPAAGVTYGGHGIWGWDDGTKPPVDHPNTGVPLPWPKALLMPGAEQMAHVANFFTGVEYWRLRPAPEILVTQPGDEAAGRYTAAAKTDRGDLVVLYVPQDRTVEILTSAVPPQFASTWFNPRTGEQAPVVGVVNDRSIQFATPAEGDWVLKLESKR